MVYESFPRKRSCSPCVWLILILLLICIGVGSVFLFKFYRKKNSEYLSGDFKLQLESRKGGCSACEQALMQNASDREQRRNLLPLMDAGFNLREISKQMILLEDHLSHARKLCNDCCTKHFLTIEALSEEAITLDKDKKYDRFTKGLPDRIRALEREFIDGKDPREIAQKLRGIRKNMQQECFPIF